MQTFLPHPSFVESAASLDDKRLRNQRNEAKVILRTLLGEYGTTAKGKPGGWPNHPATKMWRGHEEALCRYALAICAEAVRRGWTNGDLTDFFEARRQALPPTGDPAWVGDAGFHAAHRANLLRKDPEHYRALWPTDPDDLPYIWPTPTSLPIPPVP